MMLIYQAYDSCFVPLSLWVHSKYIGHYEVNEIETFLEQLPEYILQYQIAELRENEGALNLIFFKTCFAKFAASQNPIRNVQYVKLPKS